MEESESAKLLGVNSSDKGEGFLDVGQMYFFCPKPHFSILTLYRTQSTSDPGVLIKRKAIVVVLERRGTWRSVFCSGFQGWINISDDQAKSQIFMRAKSVRRYEDWRGNNYFFFNGKAMLGSDGRFFAVTNIMAALVLYLFFVHVTLATQAPLIVGTTGAIFSTIAMVNLWMVATMDPGILPRLPLHVKPQVPPDAVASKWKYCTICNIMRPAQAKHCSACQNCVSGFDHHCPYTSNCVGVRNRRFFVRFVIALNLFLALMLGAGLWVLALSVQSIHSGSILRDIEQAIVGDMVVAVASLAAFLSLLLFLPFCHYHLHIVAIGETTFERVKRIYANTVNPHDRGIVRNYAALCCGPVPESKLQGLDEGLSVEQFLKENLEPAKFEELFYKGYGTSGAAFQDVSPSSLAGSEII